MEIIMAVLQFFLSQGYQQWMEEGLQPEARLLALRSSHLLERNLGESWADIHSKMQGTIGVQDSVRSKIASMYDPPNFEEKPKNHFNRKLFHALQKKQDRQKLIIEDTAAKSQLKIMLNNYKRETCEMVVSGDAKCRLSTQISHSSDMNKQNAGELERPEKRQISEQDQNKLQSDSCFSRIMGRKSGRWAGLGDQGTLHGCIKASTIHLPTLFTHKPEDSREQCSSSQKGKDTQVFYRYEVQQRLSTEQFRSSQAQYTLPQICNTMQDGNKKRQTFKMSKGLSELNCGLIYDLNMRTIHSLDSIKKGDHLEVLKLRHHSLQKLRVSHRGKGFYAKENITDQNKLIINAKDLKIVKKRLHLDGQAITKLK